MVAISDLFTFELRDIMRKITVLSVVTMFLLISVSILTPGSIAEDNDDIAPLTVPSYIPNPESNIDVFKRLDREKTEGYLKDKKEEIWL
jgi:hypothetical protein